MKLSDYITVPLAELKIARDRRICLCDRWWIVTANDEVLFYKDYTSPQCNSNKSIAERFRPEGTRVEFVPVAYVKHSCSDHDH